VRINLVGTLNVFEAAKAHGIRKLIYTSSGGVFGPDDVDIPMPTTLYGTTKLANEGLARTYWEEARIASIGFRPFVIYGPARESGLSAGPTLACRAAAEGKPYTIPISGKAGLVYVEDVALAYCAAVQAELSGAHTLNLPGHVASMSEVAQLIREFVPGAEIGVTGEPLPSAYAVRNEWATDLLKLPPETSLRDGVRHTIDYYRR
jgi:nucleoside-diphosphate-sugar epimerase